VSELDSSGYLEVAANAALAQLTFGPDAKSRMGKTTGSALGWGVGAALGAKLARPERQVVCLQGDGSLLFAQAETLWALARHEAPVLVVVFNNRSYNGPRSRILQQGGARPRPAAR
jgi:thiamine pyrophosphate-dependent acetolactate synthase large subunit-like protein